MQCRIRFSSWDWGECADWRRREFGRALCVWRRWAGDCRPAPGTQVANLQHTGRLCRNEDAFGFGSVMVMDTVSSESRIKPVVQVVIVNTRESDLTIGC